MTEPAQVHALLSDLRQALVFQRELGLGSLKVDEGLLQPKQVASQVTASTAPVAPAVQAEAASPDKAREEIARMLQGGAAATSTAQAQQSVADSNVSGLDLAQNRMVVGAGNSKARLMLIGEASRRDVELLGEPFVGKAGELLTKMLQAMGLKRSDVYLLNVVKPRSARNKTEQSLNACEPFLRQQIEAVQPEVIVSFGDFSSRVLLRDDTPMPNLRGQWREYQGIALMPTFHPGELLRDASMKKPVWIDLQAVMQRLGLK